VGQVQGSSLRVVLHDRLSSVLVSLQRVLGIVMTTPVLFYGIRVLWHIYLYVLILLAYGYLLPAKTAVIIT